MGEEIRLALFLIFAGAAVRATAALGADGQGRYG